MKITPLFIVFLSIICLIVACSKNASTVARTNANGDTANHTPPDTTTTLIARWTVVSDSLANIKSYTFSDGEPIPGLYIGGPNDYFNFLANGTYTASEGGFSGSGTYQLLPNSGISISPKPALKKAKILQLTRNALKIYGSDTSLHGGILIETLIFKR